MKKSIFITHLVLCLAASLFFVCAKVVHAENAMQAKDEISKKRIAPASVPPVRSGGVRYEVVPFGKDHGFAQDSGIIRAFDMATGEELWKIKIFDIVKNSDIEEDKQEDFITSLRIKNGKIHIRTERSLYFLFDIKTKEIQRKNIGGLEKRRIQASTAKLGQ